MVRLAQIMIILNKNAVEQSIANIRLEGLEISEWLLKLLEDPIGLDTEDILYLIKIS